MNFIRALVLAVALLAFSSEPALAQEEGTAYSAGQLQADGFRPADQDNTEGVPGGPLMIAAYMALWLLVGGYVFRIARRHSAVQQEYATLRKSLEDIDDRLSEHTTDG
jgi:CcmD family protein